MKKLMFLILTLAVVTGCQKEEMFEQADAVEAEVSNATPNAPRILSPSGNGVIFISPEGTAPWIDVRYEPVNDATLRVEWLRNGKPLEIGGKRYEHTWGNGYIKLTIKHVIPEDAGTYTCIVRNAYGEAKVSIILRVE